MSKQKQWLKIISDNRDTLETITNLKDLNVYKFSLFQTLNLTFKFKNILVPFLSSGRVKKISHLYPASNSYNSFTEPNLDYISPNLDYNSQQKCEANEIHYIKSVKKYASFSWKCSKTLQKSPVADKSETPRPHCILSFWYRLTTNMVRFAAIFVVKQ